MASPWENKTILIIDDHQRARDEAQRAAEALSLQVVAAIDSGLQALKYIEEFEPPDFIALDIIMPEMDGIECYTKLRDLGVRSRILLISALSSEARVVQAFEQEIPAECFVAKPVTVESLERHLRVLHSLPALDESRPLLQASEPAPMDTDPHLEKPDSEV